MILSFIKTVTDVPINKADENISVTKALVVAWKDNVQVQSTLKVF